MIICADDFGMSDGINAAIIKLCQEKKIGAVSVMINHLGEAAVSSLTSFHSSVQIGLHLDVLKNGFQFENTFS